MGFGESMAVITIMSISGFIFLALWISSIPLISGIIRSVMSIQMSSFCMISSASGPEAAWVGAAQVLGVLTGTGTRAELAADSDAVLDSVAALPDWLGLAD